MTTKINMRALRESKQARVDTPRAVNTFKPISDTCRPDNSSPSVSSVVRTMLKCQLCRDPQNPKISRCLYLLEEDFNYRNGPNGQAARKQIFLDNENCGGFAPFVCPHDTDKKYMFRKTFETAPELLEINGNIRRWTAEQKDFRIWVKEELTALTYDLDQPSNAELARRNQIRQERLRELPIGR